MVFTAAQTASFFQEPTQMGIANATVIQLRVEGIDTVADLLDFDKETIVQIAANLRRPSGRVADPTIGAAVGATIATPPFTFGAKSQQRLICATKLVRYYDTIGRSNTAANLQWMPVMKNFSEQWQALEDKKADNEPEVPKISKQLPILKWTEAYTDYAHRVIGDRTIPLYYVIRPEVDAPPIGPQAAGTPHSVEHGSIETDLIYHASHGHPLFRGDNQAMYYKLEEATRGTIYAPSIKPFQKSKDGRGAWFAVVNQYAGKDKWEAEIKQNEKLLHSAEWKGQSNFTLERFIAQHRNAYVSMQAAAQHSPYQLPNPYTRVGYLLDAILCNDAGLQAAMASIKTDSQGMRTDFEAAATHLLPYDPVQKRYAGGKRAAADISDTTGEETNVSVASFGTKKGTGSTGVALRFHTTPEYKKLNVDQQDELREWRRKERAAGNGKQFGKGKPGKKGNPMKGNPMNKKAMASAVEKKVAERMKSLEKEKESAGEAEAFIMSIVKKMKTTNISDTFTKPAPAAADPRSSVPSLKSIMKQAKNMSMNDKN
jgi:hypothetical protein